MASDPPLRSWSCRLGPDALLPLATSSFFATKHGDAVTDRRQLVVAVGRSIAMTRLRAPRSRTESLVAVLVQDPRQISSSVEEANDLDVLSDGSVEDQMVREVSRSP